MEAWDKGSLVLLLLMVLGLVFVVSLIIALLMRRVATRQLKEINRIVEKMSRHEFDERLNYHDNNEMGRLARAIDQMSDELQESTKVTAIELNRRENLVRNLAHDIRTPVTVIKGYAESLLAFYEEDERIVRYSSVIVEESDRMNNMTRNMLDLLSIRDRDSYYTMNVVDTVVLFDRFQKRAENILPSQEFVVECDPCVFMANQGLIQQAVYNLVENAYKYGDKQGKIQLLGKREKGFYCFTVVNDGEKIIQKDLQYIWDVFYKTDRARKREMGYGIGLSIVREVAAFHGGGVEARCQDGKTYMSFWILIKEPADQIEKKPEE